MRRVCLLLCLVGCGSDHCEGEHAPCTDDFEIIAIDVTDQNGSAFDGLVDQTLRSSDHKDITPQDQAIIGEYVVVDDYDRAYLDATPQEVIFLLTGPNGTVSTTGMAYTDECGCHVHYDGARDVVVQR